MTPVLAVASTLPVENTVTVLFEYLQRAGQLAVLQIDAVDEQAAVQGIALRPFRILNGSFDLAERNRESLSNSEARIKSRKPLIEVHFFRPSEQRHVRGDFGGPRHLRPDTRAPWTIHREPDRSGARPICLRWRQLSPT